MFAKKGILRFAIGNRLHGKEKRVATAMPRNCQRSGCHVVLQYISGSLTRICKKK